MYREMLNGLDRNVAATASTLLTPRSKSRNVQITSAFAATNRETSVTFLSADAARVNGPRETFTDNRGYRILTSALSSFSGRALTTLPKRIS
jgi:hypothetical protein